MKIAVVSDIHGNLEALKQTLKDIKKRNIDKIIVLGDTIAKGVHPNECIELIKENCDIVLRGNCDERFAKEQDLARFSIEEQERIKWNQSIITKENSKYLLNLPFSYECYMSGSLIRFFHATPDKIDKVVINQDSIQTKFEMFCPSKYTMSQEMADVCIYGHIHQPYMDKIYNRTLINVGSVGNAFDVIRNSKKDANVLETTNSNYLIIEGEYGSKEYSSSLSFQFIKVPYNIDKELSTDIFNIEKENYVFELKEGKYRDMEKIYNNFRRLNIDVDGI